jgi:endonuclease G, mitochondrial
VQPAETELEAAIQPDPDYSDRPGFDPDFLGFAAPLPTLLPEAHDLALPVDDGVELKYHHYSVIMNAERKLALCSAVNLDAGAKFQLNRQGKDRWFYDPASIATHRSATSSTAAIRWIAAI